MKVLLHVCCSCCAIYPVQELRKEGMEVCGFFYNPNIHPYEEYSKRLEGVQEYSEKVNLKMIYRNEYALEEFLRNVAFRENDRCWYCYYARLSSTVQVAKKGKFDFFSTTLLYSKLQKHDRIQKVGDGLASEYDIPFYYKNFRKGWQEGIEASKEMGLYRQKYCGCIYSEKERYHKINV